MKFRESGMKMRIFIVECLNPMDLLQRRSEAAALEEMCRLLGHEVAVSRVQSLKCLSETCRFIASIDETHDAKRQRGLPLCVHIAAHGNADGIGIGLKFVTWHRLANAILPLGTLSNYSGPLIVILSACAAGCQSLTSELTQHWEEERQQPPAYVFVTCDDRLDWRDSVAAWTVFYHLISKAKFDQPETVRSVLAAVRTTGGAVLRYHRWVKEERAYRKYEPSSVASIGR